MSNFLFHSQDSRNQNLGQEKQKGLHILKATQYCDNIFVKRSIPTVCFAHTGINPSTKIFRVQSFLIGYFSGRTKNNRHLGYSETKLTDFKISGTRLGTTLCHCRLILETETEPGTKSRFHYLCLQGVLCSMVRLKHQYRKKTYRTYFNYLC